MIDKTKEELYDRIEREYENSLKRAHRDRRHLDLLVNDVYEIINESEIAYETVVGINNTGFSIYFNVQDKQDWLTTTKSLRSIGWKPNGELQLNVGYTCRAFKKEIGECESLYLNVLGFLKDSKCQIIKHTTEEVVEKHNYELICDES